MADRQRIVQVLNNLFSNAARHAPESSPIRVAAGRDGVYVAVSASAEGPGVPPDRLPHLFRKHAGVAGGRESETAWTGLGLAICNGLVEAHGGRIWAECGEQGQGIRFTFTLPVAEEIGASAADALVAGRSRSLQPGREQPRILVVDDDPQLLRYVRDALTGAGYTPVVTGDTRDLSQLIALHSPGGSPLLFLMS